MSVRKVGSVVAAMVTALALSATAYGDGKSPNGPPGPEGNPNQPAAQPQANGPQGPAGNETQAGSNAAAGSHGKSQAQHGKSGQSHGKSQSQSAPTQSHRNPSPGTPRKGGREDRPADKITICHATKSVKNPYVTITISMNGLHGHGPVGDSRHHEGSWQDIIPAPAGGCPTTAPEQSATAGTTEQQSGTTATQQSTETAKFVAPAPEVAAIAPATAAEQPEQAVLGARVEGKGAPAEDEVAPAQSKVLGASASGTTAPKAALAARAADERNGSLPFTGFELAIVLLAAAAALLGGFALRRATAGSRA